MTDPDEEPADWEHKPSFWTIRRLQEYLQDIQGLDQRQVHQCIEKQELVEMVLNVGTQCLRLFGSVRIHDIRGSPLAADLMKNDVHSTLAMIELEDGNSASGSPGCGWLRRVKPDWRDGVVLTRSMLVTINRDDIPAMSRCAAKCNSSMYSFSVLVTLMRALRYNDWAPALQMWSIRNPPKGCRMVAGAPPEALWAMDVNTCDRIFQRTDIRVIEEGEQASCAICLGDLVVGESVRQLMCGHRFHTACIGEWIDRQWGEVQLVLFHGGLHKAQSQSRCPTCRASTGM